MKKFLIPAMFALLLFTAGCDNPGEPPAPPPDKPASSKPTTKPDVKPQEPKPATENEKPAQKPKEKPAMIDNPSAQSLNVKVYYPDDSGMKLVEVERKITFDDSTNKYIAAVETLLEEPGEENLTKIFPDNAAIRSVTIAGDLATVDLDGSFLKNFVGGSTGEEFLVGSVVNTLTNFPEVKRVKFLVDGQEIETLSGHMDLSIPLERMSDLIS